MGHLLVFSILIAYVSVLGDLKGTTMKKRQQKPGHQKRRIISFSGYDWVVKSSNTGVLGPGPNHFSDSDENVHLDARGRLHLKLTKKGKVWRCPEVISLRSFGYGKYVFCVSGRIDRLDRNVVLGLFTYDGEAPRQYHREIDIEFARWGKADSKPGLYSVVPGWVEGNKVAFDFRLRGLRTIHSFEWKPGAVLFRSYRRTRGKPAIIKSWNYRGKYVQKPGNEKALINLWLFEGKPPSDGKEVEIVIESFEFLPPKAPPRKATKKPPAKK